MSNQEQSEVPRWAVDVLDHLKQLVENRRRESGAVIPLVEYIEARPVRMVAEREAYQVAINIIEAAIARHASAAATPQAASGKLLRDVVKASEEHERRFREAFELRADLKGDPMWEYAFEHAATHSLYPDELAAIGAAIVRKESTKTDAEGNELKASEPTQREVVGTCEACRQPIADVDDYGFSADEVRLHARCAHDYGEVSEASLPTLREVERFEIRWYPDNAEYRVTIQNYEGGEVVTAADHDRIVAEKDAEIAELRSLKNRMERAIELDRNDFNTMRDGTKLTREGLVMMIAYGNEEIAELRTESERVDSDHQRAISSLRQRAEAAEARVKELEKELEGLDTQGGNACCHGYAPHTPADYEILTAKLAAAEREIAELKHKEMP